MLDRQTMDGQMNGWMEKEVSGQREKLLPGGRGERRRSGMVAPNLREAVRSQGSGHSKESEYECQGCSHEDPRSSLLPAWLWWHETPPRAFLLPQPSSSGPPWPFPTHGPSLACSGHDYWWYLLLNDATESWPGTRPPVGGKAGSQWP